jgi:hypothetical protein
LRVGGLDVRVVRLQPWKIWLLVAVGAGLAVTLTVVVAGMFLILVPLFVLGGLVAKLLLGGGRAPVARPSDGRPDVIEGNYEVLDVRRQRSQP